MQFEAGGVVKGTSHFCQLYVKACIHKNIVNKCEIIFRGCLLPENIRGVSTLNALALL